MTAGEVKGTCAPYYELMMREGMEREVGERIAKYYMTNVVVKSLLNYTGIRE